MRLEEAESCGRSSIASLVFLGRRPANQVVIALSSTYHGHVRLGELKGAQFELSPPTIGLDSHLFRPLSTSQGQIILGEPGEVQDELSPESTKSSSFESSYAEREKSSFWASFVTNVFRSPSPDSPRPHQALTGERIPCQALTKFDTPAKKPHHQIWWVLEQNHHHHFTRPNDGQIGFSSGGGGPHDSERRILLGGWWVVAPDGGGGQREASFSTLGKFELSHWCSSPRMSQP